MIQPGTHPDAEILTAFAEQLVTDTERQEILAHMAECGRCREAVFLAQQAIEVEGPGRPAVKVLNRKASTGWFTAWRWSWIPVAALAGIIGFAVIRHVNRAPVSETRMAQNAASPPMTQNTGSSKPSVTASPERPAPAREELKVQASPPPRSDRDAELDRKSLTDKDEMAAQKKDESARSTDSLGAAAPKLADSTVHERFEARAKSSAIGGPMVQNQVQQQNNAQLQQLSNANEIRRDNESADSANKPASSPIQPGTASQTVTVEAAGGLVPTSPTPSADSATPTLKAESESAAVSGKNLAKLKAATSTLPSNLGMISQAAVGKRTIAIDSAGSVFQSSDSGNHWAPVTTQWAGRAVLVKSTPISGEVTGNVLSQHAAHFELLTDKLDTWISTDGKIWTLKAPISK